jgi:mycofactocin biosynthetic radical S-adenosylmethionine protein MftC
VTFSDILGRCWENNTLFSVLLELTHRCNLRCFFCYIDPARAGESLSLGRYHMLLEELAAMQVMNLTLSGGEPLLQPHFWEIGRRARELGFVVRLKSNGHMLRGDVVPRIKAEIDPFSIEVSLHGARAATHDAQTRIPGSFRRLMENLGQMKDGGLRVKLNSVLTRWNENEVEEMCALADDLEMPIQFDPQITPRDDGEASLQSITATDTGLRNLLRIQVGRGLKLKPRDHSAGLPPPPSNKHCGAGSSTLTVDPYGNVYPCVSLRRKVGNLHDRTVSQIWSENPELETIRDLMVQAGRVVDNLGPFGCTMSFCPGHAYVTSGDATRPYPAALRVLELRRQVYEETGDG